MSTPTTPDSVDAAGKKALVAMSGGVDSSVAVLLMQREGFDCSGVTMKLFSGETKAEKTCCSLDDVSDARSAACRLGIPYYVFDYTAQFDENVIRRFVQVYEEGGTPNPCIDCNRYLKFGSLYDRARLLGCDTIATGHYARVEQGPEGRWLLKKGLDTAKDQSYVLYMLTQEQLAHTRFPLGDMTKEAARALAAEQGLLNARKRDSQDICFVPDGDYAAFIRQYTGQDYPPGDFVDETGRVLGRHWGAIGYTIGQRRGLGVSAEKPLYVCAKRREDNAIVLGGNERLFSATLLANDLNFIAVPRLTEPVRCRARVRYRQAEQWATAEQTDEDVLRVTFDQPQRAITPGQAVVLYDGDTVIGGGTIYQTEEQ
ncbi:MAG: tRNA 2-thiouridine(34) synthase MnmA [Oscillospiraceae bacterium]|nr:tRNA 2-thiouridine(34) synthase MnmA [Oscillospiraceae bacterium]